MVLILDVAVKRAPLAAIHGIEARAQQECDSPRTSMLGLHEQQLLLRVELLVKLQVRGGALPQTLQQL